MARSNVEQLALVCPGRANRREQGLAIRSDELAAEVSLANAQLARDPGTDRARDGLGDV